MHRSLLPDITHRLARDGFAIVPNVLPTSTIDRLRMGLFSSVVARERAFLQFPELETMMKTTSRMSDPLYAGMANRIKLKQVILRRKREEKRRKRQLARVAKDLGITIHPNMTGEELAAVSEKIAKHIDLISLKGCTSTVDNDPQMLTAIDDFRCNAWMTNSELKKLMSDASFVGSVGPLVSEAGGVHRPVLFGDVPYVRNGFGSPFHYHIAAPSIGVRTNRDTGSEATRPALAILIYTHDMSATRMPLHVLRNSHKYIRHQYIHDVQPKKLHSFFIPVETHIPAQLQHFKFGDDVVGEAVQEPIVAGSVILVDPHLMYSFGPNLSSSMSGVLRMNFVGESEKPYMKAPSWIQGWRALSREVQLNSPIVFPPFFTEQPKTRDS